MTKRILVPTDFSPEADNALSVAAQIAEKHNCEIYLLHFLDFPTQTINPTRYYNQSDLPTPLFYMQRTHQLYEETLRKDFLKNIVVHETVEFHSSFHNLAKIIEKYECDLVIMGDKKPSGFHFGFKKSKLQTAIRQATVPLIRINKAYTEFEISEFVLPVDASIKNKNSFLKALAFAMKFNTKMHLYAFSPKIGAKSIEKVKNRVHKHKTHSSFYRFKGLLSKEKLFVFTQKKNANFIGIPRNLRPSFFDFFKRNLFSMLSKQQKFPAIYF